jgi:hypothetical protein
MSSAREHYEEAERLLALVRTEQDSIRRSLILAEAQVHATLALSAPAGKDPPGPGRDEAAGTENTGVAHSGIPEGSGPFEMQPSSSPGDLGRGEGGVRDSDPPATREATLNKPVRPPAVPPAVPALRYGTEPSTTRPAYPLGRKRPEKQPQEQEQEPGPGGQSPSAGDPGEQGPGGPTPFR